VDISRGQTGDVSTGDVAQSIHHGLDAADLRSILEQQTEFHMTLVSAYEQLSRDLSSKIEYVQLGLAAHETMERQRREADLVIRRRRQHIQDAWMAALTLIMLAVLASTYHPAVVAWVWH
jgi:hypothetical protein